jgi:hypothetical protein
MLRRGLVVLIGLFVALPVACGSSATPVGFNQDGGGTDTGSGGDGSGHPHLDAGSDVPTLVHDGGSKESGSGLGCSPDLHNVVNANGDVVMKCAPTDGCAAGVCVPACQAAGADHGTVGCSFMVATPSFYAGYAAPCFSVFVANDWSEPATIEVSRGGTSYDVTTFGRIAEPTTPPTSWAAVPTSGLPSGQVAVLFLSADPSAPYLCPVTPALSSGTAVIGTGTGQAWQIQTSIPVTSYDELPYGGAPSVLPSAELILPTTAWGTNYIAVVPQVGNRSNPFGNGPQWGQILAVQDGTTVKVVPTVALPSGTGVAAAPAAAVTTYTLSAGEFIQWQAPWTSGSTAPLEMEGTVVSSNLPVAFMGGNGYLCYNSATTTGGGCDSAHQQIPPVNALGNEYAVAPYTTRRADLMPESIPYRIVGAVAGTTLTYDPPVTGAPPTLDQGTSVDFEAIGGFVVKSQDNKHPFYIGQTMTGCEVESGSRSTDGCDGDEEFVNVVAPAQYLPGYVFFTDPSYGTTNLVFVREQTKGGSFADVTLDCTGTLTGWTAIGSSGKYEMTNVDIARDNVANGTCANGPHSATSQGGFGLTVWGTAAAASYAYPAGGNVAAINSVVIPPTPPK